MRQSAAVTQGQGRRISHVERSIRAVARQFGEPFSLANIENSLEDTLGRIEQ